MNNEPGFSLFPGQRCAKTFPKGCEQGERDPSWVVKLYLYCVGSSRECASGAQYVGIWRLEDPGVCEEGEKHCPLELGSWD